MRPRLTFGLVLLLLLTSCASAGKRLEQGVDLERQGRDDQAIARYVQALQKDPDLAEARARLTEVGERAVNEHLRVARSLQGQHDPVAAALELRAVDGVVASARSVGVRLPLAATYSADRRTTLSDAVESLLAEGAAAHDRGRWQDGLSAYRRARGEFEPSSAQRDAALTGESRILVDFSRAELHSGHLRSAYDLAEQVHRLEWSPAQEHQDAADLMFTALARGEVELMTLPVVASERSRDGGLLDLEVRVNDALDRSAWRSPPPFVRITDPVAVREVVRQAGGLRGGVRAPLLGLLLRAVDADYGAWLELVEVDATEFEVKRTTRAVKTHGGRATSFVLEEGQRRMRAQARVIVVDRDGNEVTNQLVNGVATRPFRRGVYEGDPKELNLDRRDVDAFDPLVLGAQEQAMRQAMAVELSAQLGTAVLEPVLARIP